MSFQWLWALIYILILVFDIVNSLAPLFEPDDWPEDEIAHNK